MVAGQDMRSIGSKGGKASGLARLRSKETREIARSVLSAKFLPQGKLSESLKSIGIDVSKPMQLRSAICAVMGGMALSGNIKAASFIFDLAEETNNSRFTSARRKMLERMVDAPEKVDVDENGYLPTPETLGEMRRQAIEMGVYEDAD